MNTQKFDGMGKIYSQFRPSYPQSFIDYLYSEVGINKKSVIADVGSGTGILTRLLIERGNKVYAVEPNDDMRKIAEETLSNFVSVKGEAKDTTLEANSIDFITVAQAFHWFGREEFKAECKRILKPHGKVILVWNSRDENSGLVQENDLIHMKYCPLFKGFSGGMRGATGKDDNSYSDFFDGEYESKVFNNDLKFGEQGFIGRNLSASYSLKEGEENYSEYIIELKTLFAKYCRNSFVVMPNFTRSYVGVV
ncbi:MAG: class I SAM-dependent methyltransferase [Oscillospiraceae bacterium]|nr:class I SAM-dependent methyltransferase [Oscillospiraceae bacterium]